MDRWRGVQLLPRSRAASGALLPTMGISLGLLLLLAGCGGGGDRQVTVARGASTAVVGDVPTVATLSAADPGRPAPASPDAERPRMVTAATPAAAPPATPAASATPTTTAAPAAQVATLHGVVTRGGQPAPGARLTLVADGGAEQVTTADGTGAYRFTAVPPGHYQLIAYAETGATCDQNGCISASWAERVELTVAAGETRRLDIDGD